MISINDAKSQSYGVQETHRPHVWREQEDDLAMCEDKLNIVKYHLEGGGLGAGRFEDRNGLTLLLAYLSVHNLSTLIQPWQKQLQLLH